MGLRSLWVNGYRSSVLHQTYLFLISQSCFEELDEQILGPPVVIWGTGGHFLSDRDVIRTTVDTYYRLTHTDIQYSLYKYCISLLSGNLIFPLLKPTPYLNLLQYHTSIK